MPQIPREARDGLMRAWLAILAEKQPQYAWIAAEQKSPEVEASIDGSALVSGAVVAQQIVRAA